MANFAGMVRDSAMVTMSTLNSSIVSYRNGELIKNHHRSFPMVRSMSKMTPDNLSFRQNGDPRCIPRDMSTYRYILDGHISTTGHPTHFMFRCVYTFRGWRIEWRYFRFDQIQEGSQPSSWKITAASRGFPATARLSCMVAYHAQTSQ